MKENKFAYVKDIYEASNVISLDLSKDPRTYINKLVEMKYGKYKNFKNAILFLKKITNFEKNLLF